MSQPVGGMTHKRIHDDDDDDDCYDDDDNDDYGDLNRPW